MVKTTLHILDEVNIKFSNLSPECRRAMVNSLKFILPYARHLPSVKLGRWDGSMSFCDIAGRSYLNLLDILLPIVQSHGYEIEIDDRRQPTEEFVFEEVKEDSYAHIKWPKGHPRAGESIEIREHQLDVINSYLENITGINIAPTGAGKAQPLYSKIKTPTGWTTMGDIKLGDSITTPSGAVSSIIGVFPQGKKDIYRITFSDGRTADCCKDHLWKVYNKHWANKWKIIDTTELIRLKTETNGAYYVPLLLDDSQDNTTLPLDPYFLGILLGDGSFRNGQLGFSTADTELIKYIETVIDSDYYVKKLDGIYDYAICIRKEVYDRLGNNAGNLKDTGIFHKYRKIIADLGLDHKLSHEKFIPVAYKCSSITQKESLIAGLVDTDGYVGRNGEISISTSSEQMAADVQEIVRSIGGISTIKSKIPTYTYLGEKKNGIRNYTVTIRYPNRKLLSRLSRKLTRISDNYQYSNLKLGVEKIELVGNEEAQCIMIDHADHLYITDNFVVTHNTIITAILSHKVEPYGRSIVIVPTKDLVTQTEEDYINFGLDVGVFYGDRKEYNKTHTICTWQSLESLNKRSKEQELEININDFFEGVVCVIVDECFHPDSLVLTPSGYLKISEINVGDTIINYSEDKHIFKEDIVEYVHKNLTKSSNEKMYELEFDNGRKIKVTGNHRFLTQRGWIRADQINEEDDIKSINT